MTGARARAGAGTTRARAGAAGTTRARSAAAITPAVARLDDHSGGRRTSRTSIDDRARRRRRTSRTHDDARRRRRRGRRRLHHDLARSPARLADPAPGHVDPVAAALDPARRDVVPTEPAWSDPPPATPRPRAPRPRPVARLPDRPLPARGGLRLLARRGRGYLHPDPLRVREAGGEEDDSGDQQRQPSPRAHLLSLRSAGPVPGSSVCPDRCRRRLSEARPPMGHVARWEP